jgi:hypothetical protein
VAQRKQWSEYTPGQRKAISVGALIEALLTTFALIDLLRRPNTQIRGSKPMWFLSLFVQPFGPIAYLVAGRRARGAAG